MEKTTTVTHVLNRSSGAVCDFERAIFSDFGTSEVGLEEGTHLSIAKTRMVEDEEVKLERSHVDEDGEND